MSEQENDITVELTDPTAWVDRHGDLLFRYAMTRIGDRHVAEDLVQETFVAALKSGKFSGQAEEHTWFVGILKHKIVDYYRRRDRERPNPAIQPKKQEELFDEKGWWRVQPAKWPVDAGNTLETAEFWEAFRLCLAGLPQRMRLVFSLREMDDHSTEQVCEEFQITASNLGVLLYRARMGLRRCLEVNWFGIETDEVGK